MCRDDTKSWLIAGGSKTDRRRELSGYGALLCEVEPK